MIMPGSWAGLLEAFRPVFRRRGTFVFTVLATGMVAQTGRRSVAGMLSGARMAGAISFHAACRFFSSAVWDLDQMGLVAARLIVDRLLPPGEPVTVVVDDTLYKRWGRKVHHAFWTHDGSAQGGKKIARGNRWVVAGIVVRLPFCTAAVCLPVLFRLWAGKATTTPVELAGQLVGLVAEAFPDRAVHGGRGCRLPRQATAGTRHDAGDRLPASAALFDVAPPPTGKPGRRALKRAKLAALAAGAVWEKTTACRYGRTETVYLARLRCIRHGSFGNAAGWCVQVRELGSAKPCDLALFTLDAAATAAQVVERYAVGGRSKRRTPSVSSRWVSGRPATG